LTTSTDSVTGRVTRSVVVPEHLPVLRGTTAGPHRGRVHPVLVGVLDDHLVGEPVLHGLDDRHARVGRPAGGVGQRVPPLLLEAVFGPLAGVDVLVAGVRGVDRPVDDVQRVQVGVQRRREGDGPVGGVTAVGG